MSTVQVNPCLPQIFFYPIHFLRLWHERICLDRWKEINSRDVFSVVGGAFWCGTKKKNIQQIKWISICVVVISGLFIKRGCMKQGKSFGFFFPVLLCLSHCLALCSCVIPFVVNCLSSCRLIYCIHCLLVSLSVCICHFLSLSDWFFFSICI